MPVEILLNIHKTEMGVEYVPEGNAINLKENTELEFGGAVGHARALHESLEP